MYSQTVYSFLQKINTKRTNSPSQMLVFDTGVMMTLVSDGQFICDGHEHFENGHER